MVTRDNDVLSTLSSKLDLNKWDLCDRSKRDPWLLQVEAALSEDPDVAAAVKYGPPTPEKLMKRSPVLTRSAAQNLSTNLTSSYAAANKRGYSILLKRLDFSKKPATARRVLRMIAPASDGHALTE